LFQV